MRIQIWHKNVTWNLKLFFSISLTLHLLLFTITSILFPDVKIDRLPILNIEVSLLPLIPEVKIPTKEINKKDPFTVQKSQIIIHKEIKPQQNENRDEPTYEKEVESESPPIEAVAKSVPLEEQKLLAPPLKEEKIVEEPMAKVVAIPLSPEAKSDENPSPTPTQIEEEPIDKKELEPVKPSPIQVATRIPVEKPEPLPQHRKEEKTIKEPVKTAMAVPPPSETGLTLKSREGSSSSKEVPSQAVEKIIPVEESKTLPLKEGVQEGEGKKEENVVKEPMIEAMHIPLPLDSFITFREEKNSHSFTTEAPSKRETPSIAMPQSKGDHKNIVPPTSSLKESQNIVKLQPPSDRGLFFAQPKYVENPKPLYPQEARKRGYEGVVVLRVEVLSNGRVGQIEIKKSSGYEVLDRSALTAVKQWRFIPANEGNGFIPCWVNIPIKFQLQ